jgi:hypothetical protein
MASESILMFDDEKEQTISMVMRQTTFTRETVIEKLHQHNNDVFSILREFMRIPDKKHERKISMNQTIYKEIRATLGSVPIETMEMINQSNQSKN